MLFLADETTRWYFLHLGVTGISAKKDDQVAELLRKFDDVLISFLAKDI